MTSWVFYNVDSATTAPDLMCTLAIPSEIEILLSMENDQLLTVTILWFYLTILTITH